MQTNDGQCISPYPDKVLRFTMDSKVSTNSLFFVSAKYQACDILLFLQNQLCIGVDRTGSAKLILIDFLL